jgi:hypothetical protein
MKRLIGVVVVAQLINVAIVGAGHSLSAERETLVAKKMQGWVVEQIKLFNTINNAALSLSNCESFKLVTTRVTTLPPSESALRPIPRNAEWSERWRVSECGVLWDYSIRYSANSVGRLTLEISPRGGGPGTVSCILPDGKERLLSLPSCTEAGGKTLP